MLPPFCVMQEATTFRGLTPEENNRLALTDVRFCR